MLDSTKATREDVEGTLSPQQRQHCQALLDKLGALPAGPQGGTGKSSGTTADGRQDSTPERQAERKRLEDDYRQACNQDRR